MKFDIHLPDYTASYPRKTATSLRSHSAALFNYVCKGKGHTSTGHKGPGEEIRCSSTLSLTSAIDGVGGKRHAPAALPLQTYPAPIAQEAGWTNKLEYQISTPAGILTPNRPAYSQSPYRLR